ncbi:MULTISPECIES: imidazolonepropionase [Aminobacterium]|jgi:imidazolonepropionase|uniref:imidazolonepropionase n=1 Tax=Aminobacterium TaxID=81466 RepID=UPI00257E676F|nr:MULTISPECIES: imidazolonepropionase [unclassified Aminobacterium]
MISALFRNAVIYSPVDSPVPLSGVTQGHVTSYKKGALFCKNGIIEKVGEEEDVLRQLSSDEVDMEINCEGSCLIPGFVDPHTHICFANRREQEFSLRIAGTPYLEILKAGGGILSSVHAVEKASEDELFESTLTHVLSALELGTTTIEIKSGYGLATETELKMLRVIQRIRKETPLDVAITFMGAHAVPKEYKENPDEYVHLMIEEMIPAISQQGIAEFCDVFCEEGVFSVGQSRAILEAARKYGMKLRIHADEVHDTGGAKLAAELPTVSAEHLLAASEENLNAMAHAGVIANLLPATAYSLRKPYASARRMIELGVPVALATDCNPGSCFTESMPFVFGLAVMNMHMTVEEALVGTTLNGAWSLGMEKKVGSLSVGKQADFLLLDGESPAVLAYHAGVSPVFAVYKKGVRVA